MILAALALGLAFTAGWQAGRVTSPYYAAHPIIFSEPTNAPADLGALAATPAPTPASEVSESSTSPEPSVAGAKDVTGASTQRFVGSVNSDKYHDPSCSGANQIKPANQVWFATREEAEAAGYSPSACTKEKLGL